MKPLVEIINKHTGETFCVPAHSIQFVHWYNEDHELQATSVRFADMEIEVDSTYDEICHQLKKEGYDIAVRVLSLPLSLRQK